MLSGSIRPTEESSDALLYYVGLDMADLTPQTSMLLGRRVV